MTMPNKIIRNFDQLLQIQIRLLQAGIQQAKAFRPMQQCMVELHQTGLLQHQSFRLGAGQPAARGAKGFGNCRRRPPHLRFAHTRI